MYLAEDMIIRGGSVKRKTTASSVKGCTKNCTVCNRNCINYKKNNISDMSKRKENKDVSLECERFKYMRFVPCSSEVSERLKVYLSKQMSSFKVSENQGLGVDVKVNELIPLEEFCRKEELSCHPTVELGEVPINNYHLYREEAII